uniref:RING-type domain-containing protein n=1 Tax=Globodera rostochiensis TaxID=31243 RepID=A0A914GVU2_GLORO
MFGCLDAGPLWGKKRSSSSSSTKKSSSLSSNDQAGSNRSAKPSANANSRDEQQRKTKTNQSMKGQQCTICLGHLPIGASKKKLKLPNCTHEFHRGCINTWLENHNTCPVCREPATKELPPGRTAPNNENEQQTTQHQHTITGETQTFPQLPWQNAPSSENGGWESYQHLLNDQRNNEHGQSYNGGPQHYWDQAQNQMPSNEQHHQEYGQQNQGRFNDNYNAADLALDTVGLITNRIGRVLTAAGNSVNNYLYGTQDSEQMYTSQSVYDNPLYHDHHHMGTSYDNPFYDAGPSLTTGPYGQPAHGQGMHMRDPYGHMDTGIYYDFW